MEDMDVIPAETGKLMARYYLAYDTMGGFATVFLFVLQEFEKETCH